MILVPLKKISRETAFRLFFNSVTSAEDFKELVDGTAGQCYYVAVEENSDYWFMFNLPIRPIVESVVRHKIYEVEEEKIKRLMPVVKNPRNRITVFIGFDYENEQKQTGEIKPYIFDGQHRLFAAHKLGIKTIKVFVPELDIKRMKKFFANMAR